MTLDLRQLLGILFARLSCGDKACDRDISAVILAVLFDFVMLCIATTSCACTLASCCSAVSGLPLHLLSGSTIPSTLV